MFPSSVLLASRDAAFSSVGRVLAIASWPDVPVAWNRRLRRAGRTLIDLRRGARAGPAPSIRASIELSPSYFEVYPDDLDGILVHEAVHVGMGLLGLAVDHGASFRRACVAARGMLHSRHMPGRVFRYRCPVCSLTFDRLRRPSDDRWCAACADAAERAGTHPYARGRALQLVAVEFRGRGAELAAAPPCDGPVVLATGGRG